jgi:hypothetical protein
MPRRCSQGSAKSSYWNAHYWYIVCRHCRLTWYLPKDARKRTDDALAILRVHAQEHRPNRMEVHMDNEQKAKDGFEQIYREVHSLCVRYLNGTAARMQMMSPPLCSAMQSAG